MDPIPTLDAVTLTSTAGILVGTTIIVAVLKRLFGTSPTFGRIPIFVYVTGVALILTIIANRFLHTLPGSLGFVLWQTAQSALASSGFYTWIARGQIVTPIAETQGASTMPGDGGFRIGLVLLPLVMLLGGCAATPTARWAQARDSLSLAERAVLRQHEAGTISDDDLIALDDFVQGARRSLKNAEKLLPQGNGQFDFYLDLVEGVLEKLTDPAFTKLAPSPLTPTGGIHGTSRNSGGDSDGSRPDRLGAATGGAAAAVGRIHARAA